MVPMSIKINWSGNAWSSLWGIILLLSPTGTATAAGTELPAALSYIHDNELMIMRPGAADSIVVSDGNWAQPMTPVFIDDKGETVLFAAQQVARRAGRGRGGVNIEIADLYLAGPGGVTQLTDLGSFSVSPDYSQVSQRIIFVSNHHARLRKLMPQTNSMQLYLKRNSWNMARRLTNTVGDKFNPQWAPDGLRVAFARLQGDSFGIHVLEVDTGRTIEVASHGNYPTWRPDGRAIAFSNNGRIFEVEMDACGATGSARPLLPSFKGYCSFLRWTESGLLFQWARAREQGISLFTPADGRVRVLVSGAGEYGSSDLALSANR